VSSYLFSSSPLTDASGACHHSTLDSILMLKPGCPDSEKTRAALQITVQGENGKVGMLTSDGQQPLDKRKPALEDVDLNDDSAAEPAVDVSDTGKLVQARVPQYVFCKTLHMHPYLLCRLMPSSKR